MCGFAQNSYVSNPYSIGCGVEMGSRTQKCADSAYKNHVSNLLPQGVGQIPKTFFCLELHEMYRSAVKSVYNPTPMRAQLKDGSSTPKYFARNQMKCAESA